MFSKDYINDLKSLHSDKSRSKGFGGKVKSLGSFKRFMTQWYPQYVLDYGCGKGVMLAHLIDLYPDTNFAGYDPAVHMFNHRPARQYDCVFSNDVLEHIEPEFIDDVLEDINSYARYFIWLRIDTKPARKKLPDGRNAHLIIKDEDWWLDKVSTQIGNIVYTELTEKGKLDIAIEKQNG